MPEEHKDPEHMSSTVKWLIGGVGAGLVAVGAWVGAALNNSFAREDKNREYLQTEIDKGRTERVELAKALHAVADGSKEQTKAVMTQTALIERKFDILIADQRHLPAIREAYAKEPRPETP